MHRCGVVLAGSQRTLAGWKSRCLLPSENDGIVTAEEIGSLNLQDTWLVVLSAATPIGVASAGEGVVRLRRGFTQAGAQNLLMTLLPIDDEKTPSIIADFYRTACKLNDAPRTLAKVQRDWLVTLRRQKGFGGSLQERRLLPSEFPREKLNSGNTTHQICKRL